MRLIGLMSGTSADGIDAALADIHADGPGPGLHAHLVAFVCVPHTAAMRDAVLRLCDPAASGVPDLCALDFALGERLAEAALALTAHAGVPIAEVDAIASHGQTVWHQPRPVDAGGVLTSGTLQIGRPAVIAARTGRPVVADFRSADMAAGGQGAPLVPYADWALLTHPAQSRAIQNIGGIANVTHLPAAAGVEDVIAFDTGPGNMLIDALVRRFTGGRLQCDENGAWAARGTCLEAVAEGVLAHPFFGTPPPRSTGREEFGDAFADRLLAAAAGHATGPDREADLLATVTEVTARSIAQAYSRWLAPRGGADLVVVGGGGTHNATLMAALRRVLAPARVTTHAEFGIDDDAKEALAFALLGYETLQGRPANVPGATGASRCVVLGSVTPAPR